MNRAPTIGSCVKAAGRLKPDHDLSAPAFAEGFLRNSLGQLQVRSVVLWVLLIVLKIPPASRVSRRIVSRISSGHYEMMKRSRFLISIAELFCGMRSSGMGVAELCTIPCQTVQCPTIRCSKQAVVSISVKALNFKNAQATLHFLLRND